MMYILLKEGSDPNHKDSVLLFLLIFRLREIVFNML